jgi:hypothetical protein
LLTLVPINGLVKRYASPALFTKKFSNKLSS